MTRDNLYKTVESIRYSQLHPADRRELTRFLEEKRIEIASKYVELCRRLHEVQHEESNPAEASNTRPRTE